MYRRFRAYIVAIFAFGIAVVLGACSNGGNHIPPTVLRTPFPTQSPSQSPAPVVTATPVPGEASVQVIVPLTGAAALSTRRVKPQFVASESNGLTLAFTDHLSGKLVLTQSVSIASGATGCATGATTRTCTLPFTIAPTATGDSYDIAVTTYDAAPTGGTIPPTAHQLASGIVAQQVITAGANTIPISLILNGTPASIAFGAATLLTTGTASTTAYAVNVLDSAANIIVGAYSAPVTVGITDTGNHSKVTLGTSPGASVTLNSSTDAANVAIAYDGDGPAGYAATLSALGGAKSISALSVSAALSTGATTNGATLSSGALPNVVLTALSQTVTYTVTDANYAGTLVANITTVSGTCPTAPTASAAGSPATFTLTFASNASCTLAFGNGSAALPSVSAAISTGSGSITVSPIGTITSYGGATSPQAIVAGPDGNLWFTDVGNGAVGKITTAGVVTEYPSLNARFDITVGPDGNLWFTSGSGLGKITTGGTSTIYSDPGAVGNLNGIAAGLDGNLWFTDCASGGKVGKITTSGTITEYGGSLSFPQGIVAGPDGKLWFTVEGNGASSGSIGTITTAGIITEYGGSLNAPDGITAGPDGNLWFATEGTNISNYAQSTNGGIGKITTAGTITMYGGSLLAPSAIATGPDGNLWFSEYGGQVGSISTSGSPITLYGSSLGQLTGIALGPDGNMWFTEVSNGNIGKIVP